MPQEKHFWDETRKPYNDLEGERRLVKPQKTAKGTSKASASTGMANQMMAGYFAEMVMNEAAKDFATQSGETLPQDFPSAVNTCENCCEEEESVDENQVTAQIEDDLEAIRRKRLEQIIKESQIRGKFAGLGHGHYTEIVEADFLKTVTSSPRCVVHFFHAGFGRCSVMDKHLSAIAPLSFGSRYVKINAEKCPFFVEKLNVKVLPTLIFFIDGVTRSRLVGFDEVPGGDACTSMALARLLKKERMIVGEEDFKAIDQLRVEEEEMGGRKSKTSSSVDVDYDEDFFLD